MVRDGAVSTVRLTRAERAGHTRRELLDAAQRLFFSDGYHGTTLDDIADEAGYTKGAVYSTFKSKGGLCLALFDVVVDRRVEEIRLLLAPHESDRAKIEALERMIDPGGVPDDLMASVQRLLLGPDARAAG